MRMRADRLCEHSLSPTIVVSRCVSQQGALARPEDGRLDAHTSSTSTGERRLPYGPGRDRGGIRQWYPGLYSVLARSLIHLCRHEIVQSCTVAKIHHQPPSHMRALSEHFQ